MKVLPQSISLFVNYGKLKATGGVLLFVIFVERSVTRLARTIYTTVRSNRFRYLRCIRRLSLG